MSNIIANFINEILNETDEGQAIIQRNDLANHFNCVPSQINYVISTRFTPDHGYYVESQRGGGGYIKITKVKITKSDYLMHIITSIGDKVTQKEAEIFVKNILKTDIISLREAKLILSATNDKAINVDNRDELRASILKSMLINLV
jgi:transcriptional regulator CtsR